MYISVKPAYGRDYANKKAVTADFLVGKDFEIDPRIPGQGKYINKDDLPPGSRLEIRYCRGTKKVCLP